uniref:Uncharacterized protein n=1 Tax=Oryza brachyantha TaxID=4533 RepID=J3N187_ORYBR
MKAVEQQSKNTPAKGGNGISLEKRQKKRRGKTIGRNYGFLATHAVSSRLYMIPYQILFDVITAFYYLM